MPCLTCLVHVAMSFSLGEANGGLHQAMDRELEQPPRIMVRLLLISIVATLAATGLPAAAGSTQASGETLIVGAGAFPSISSAVQAATVGDTVVVESGVYYEEVVPSSGITIEAAPGASVAVDGSEPSLVSGGWQNYSGDIYYANVYWPVYYVAQDDIRLFRYGSLASLSWGGYFNDESAGRVYVRLTDGSGPDAHQMHVARRDATFLWAGANNVTLRGLELRYCN